jgi:hypothetical protein
MTKSPLSSSSAAWKQRRIDPKLDFGIGLLSYEPFYALSGWWPVTVAAAPPAIAAKTNTDIAIITSYILWARMWAQFTINYVSDYNK